MPKSKKPDRSIVDAILKAKMKGFRRVEAAVPQGQARSQATTPDLSSLKTKARALPDDARLTQRAAAILKRNLGDTPVPDDIPAVNVPAPVPDDDVEMALVRPDRESTADDPADAKAVVIQKSKKKIILRQG